MVEHKMHMIKLYEKYKKERSGSMCVCARTKKKKTLIDLIVRQCKL